MSDLGGTPSYLADPDVVADLQRELADAKARVDELEFEVEKADNARSFGANTECEIAALKRELRDTKAKLTQITLERERFEVAVRDMRECARSRGRRRKSPRASYADSSVALGLVAPSRPWEGYRSRPSGKIGRSLRKLQ